MNTIPAFFVPMVLIVVLIVLAFFLIYPRQMDMVSLVDNGANTDTTNTRIVSIQPVTSSYSSWPWSSMGWNNWFGYQAHNNNRFPYYSRPVAYNNF